MHKSVLIAFAVAAVVICTVHADRMTDAAEQAQAEAEIMSLAPSMTNVLESLTRMKRGGGRGHGHGHGPGKGGGAAGPVYICGYIGSKQGYGGGGGYGR